MKQLNGVRLVFHSGLFMAVSALLLVIVSASLPRDISFSQDLRGLIRVETAIIYVFLALIHMVLLSVTVRVCPEQSRARAVGFLYTAGFVHTLIALGVAIALGGAELIETGAIAPQTVGVVLFPMGAAVLPHALGVWAGQDIEAGLRTSGDVIQDGVLGRLQRDADHAQDTLRGLYQTRQELLEKEISTMKTQLDAWKRIESQTSAWLSEVRKHTAPVAHLMKDISTSAKQTRDAFSELGKAVREGTADVRRAKPDLDEFVNTIGKLDELADSIVELLNSRLFGAAK